jgi:hypothetical protein
MAKQMMFMWIGTGDEEKIKQAKELIQQIGLVLKDTYQCEEFYTWLDTIPNEGIEGFNERAVEWISHWGNGGGDHSTEANVEEASESNNPRVWAEEAYNRIVGYSKNNYEAGQLIIELVNNVLKDLAAQDKADL